MHLGLPEGVKTPGALSHKAEEASRLAGATSTLKRGLSLPNKSLYDCICFQVLRW